MDTSQKAEREQFRFAVALDKLGQERKKVARLGWNGAKLGKVAFIVFQEGYPQGVPANANTAAALGIDVGTVVAVEPYLTLCVKLDEGDDRRGEKGAEYLLRPWTPDQRDLLATDWVVVE